MTKAPRTADVDDGKRLMRRDYEALTTGAAAVDFGDRALLEADGPDAGSFLQGMLSNDLARLKPGEGSLAVLLTPIGKMVADFVVLRLSPERFHLICSSTAAPAAAAALNRFIITDRVEVREMPAIRGLAVLGPSTRPALAEHLPELPEEPLAHAESAIAGIRVRAVRDTRFGVDGYSLWFDAPAAPRLREALGVPGAGREAFEALRIEAGVPSQGVDFDGSHLPLECNLDSAISFTKGCYIGQEVVSRVTYLGGVPKKLMGLAGDEGGRLNVGEDLRIDGEAAGRVTSASFSFRLGRPVALAYVQKKFLQHVQATLEPSGEPAEIRPLPLIPSQLQHLLRIEGGKE